MVVTVRGKGGGVIDRVRQIPKADMKFMTQIITSITTAYNGHDIPSNANNFPTPTDLYKHGH